MRIAIDFDGTYDRDPELWRAYIFHATNLGHECIVVTMRYDIPATRIDISLPCPVHYTSHKAKREHMKSLGMRVDVWIDDKPEFVVEDHPHQ